MNKSFKTLTLIAAIGMSAAALFFGAEYAMSHWLGMWYITLGSLAFRIVRHLFIALQILSAILFFFGAYRFPNQLPKRNGWLIAAAIVMLLLLCGELYRMYILFYPIYYDLSLLVLSIAAAGAMWSCYAKSEESPAGKVTRYLSLLTSIAFALYFILHAILCAGWYYYNMVYENSFEMYELFEYCYQIALACAAVWLIAVLIRSILPQKNDRTMKRILIFALTAVLTIAFTSCGQSQKESQQQSQDATPEFVCYYFHKTGVQPAEEGAPEHTFQIYRDVECPLPVNEVWRSIHDTIVADVLRDFRSWIDTLDGSHVQKLFMYPAIVMKDQENALAYEHNDYVSLRSICLTDSLYGYYCRTKWYDMGVHGSEQFLYRYFDLRTDKTIHVSDLLSDDVTVAHYLDSTIRQSEKAWGVTADPITPNDNFIISDSGLTFVYNEYEIGCYAIDTVMCTVPLSVLDPCIKKEWRSLWPQNP